MYVYIICVEHNGVRPRKSLGPGPWPRKYETTAATIMEELPIYNPKLGISQQLYYIIYVLYRRHNYY